MQSSASSVPQFRPWLQEWLQVLGRVEPEGAQQEHARQAMLRTATELRGRLVAAREQCDAASLDLEALLLQRRRREEQRRQQEGAQQAAVAAAVQDLFGDSDGSDAGSIGDDAEDMQQMGQKRKQAVVSQRLFNAAAGPSGSRQRQPGQRQHGQRQQAPDDDDNPYLNIVDPAAPRPLLPQRSPVAAAVAAAAAAAAKLAAAGPPRGSSSLPAEVRRKLAEQVWPAASSLPGGMLICGGDVAFVPTSRRLFLACL
jgi:hypothetical protein